MISSKSANAVAADREHNRDFLDFLETLVTIDLADESPLSGGNRHAATSYDNLRKRLLRSDGSQHLEIKS